MTLRRTGVALAVMAVALAALVLSTRGPSAPTPNPPGSFSFAALGDSPYFWFEDLQYRVVLQDIAAHPLALVVHVGDIFWEACTSERYRRSLEEFDALPHPVIYTPGDNEWTDCAGWSDDFVPQDRLSELRRIFFADPTRSLGGERIALAHQGEGSSFPEYVENARWTHEGFVFATIHLVGSDNGLAPFEGRTESDDRLSKERTEAAISWLRETFAEAKESGALGVVLVYHVNLGFEEPVDSSYRLNYEPFTATLEEEVAAYELPVLAIHGDWHEYTVDQPLVRRTTGEPLDNFTRLQVPGSYDVGWVRVTVSPHALQPFAFESRVVPHWKYW